jgi:SAM-dependent methyltransferase
MEPSLTFDQVAGLYRTTRPDYPEALIEDVVSQADLKPNDKILEVGCGSGQATKSFAKRGFPIVAIDPGPEMLRGARESLAGFRNVKFLEATFEAWPAKQREFRLIIAAQSWHWLSPEVRFVKAAEVLSPDGSLAIFGHVPVGLPPSLLPSFKDIYLRHTGKWGRPPEAWYLPDGPFKGWFEASGLFGPVAHHSYPWKWRHSRSSYVGFLRTKSEIRMLEHPSREAMLDEIAKAIDDRGGNFTVDYESHLFVARVLNRG